jgi:hypothetical protein
MALNKKRKGKAEWVDESFLDDIMDASAVRQVKFKERKPADKSTREMTRLIRTTPSWPMVINELKLLPKRKK